MATKKTKTTASKTTASKKATTTKNNTTTRKKTVITKAATKTTASTTAKTAKTTFPTNELKKWVKGRYNWNDADWWELLDSLRHKGYKQIVDTPQGQAKIGQFIEEQKTLQIKVPKTEVNKWLKNHQTWNHNEWLGLLSELRSKGFNEVADTDIGQKVLGTYLEENKS